MTMPGSSHGTRAIGVESLAARAWSMASAAW